MSDPYAGIGTPDNDPYEGIATVDNARKMMPVTSTMGKRSVRFMAPEGASEDEIQNLAKQEFARSGTPVPKNAEMRFIDNRAVFKTDTSGTRGLVSGALKPLDNLTTAAMNIPGMAAIDRFGQRLGFPSAEEAAAGNQAVRENNTRTGYQTLGNIAGTLPAVALPGGPLVQGGATGALLSDAGSPEGVLTDSATGALFGKGSQMALGGLSWLAKPVVSKASEALYAAGVPQTLGQIASQGKGFGARAVAGAEEKLMGLPLIGDLIEQARGRGTEGFNRALGNRILSNINQAVPNGMEAGSGMVKFVKDKLNDAYTALVPRLSTRGDQQFATELAQAKAATSTLPDDMQRQFGKIMLDVFENRIDNGALRGQALKDAESSLTAKITQYRNSTNPDQRIMADALDQARQSFRGLVERSNPTYAGELQALNKAWAQSKTLRAAANAPGNATGVVTPAQMLSAARKSGFDDQFIKDAKMVLPSTTPNSGTTGRAATAGLLGTLGTGAAAGTLVSPAAALPAAPALLYTDLGQQALNKFVFGARPQLVRKGAQALDVASRYTPSAIPALTQEGR